MTKTTKRHTKRPKNFKRENAAASGDDRLSTGQGPGKNRSSVADNKCVRVVGLMILPVLFGVFGLLMFPPSFDSTSSNVGNIVNDTIKSKEPILSSDNTINDDIHNKKKTNGDTDRDDAADRQNVQGQAQGDEKGNKGKTVSQSSKKKKIKKYSNSNKALQADKQKEEKIATKSEPNTPTVADEINNFKPTILDSLDVREIVVQGRTLKPIELTKDVPDSPIKAYIYEGFLSDGECEGLKKVHRQHIEETTVNGPLICFESLSTLRKHLRDAGRSDIKVTQSDFTPGTVCVNETFSAQLTPLLTWSYSTAFYPGESRFSSIFEERVYKATGLTVSNGGKFQITSYPEGIGYKTHTDCILNNPDKRDRFGTILVYLQDVEEGGETKFPELGISVKPKKGTALVWNNMNSRGECEPLSVHEAAQVNTGHKYILQRWYYFESFYQLGKRPAEPVAPARAPNQPRVSCDQYEQGSCRWYDEWNYEHLLDYRAVKKDLL